VITDHLSFISRSDDAELREIESRIAGPVVVVDGRADIEAALCRLLAAGAPPAPRTLDLIGHSTAGTSLLVMGDWVIDATSPTVIAFFRELAEQNVVARLGLQAVRLLGCATAVTEHGRYTVCALADLLGIEVVGTTAPVLASYYEPAGFSRDRRYLLTSATELRARGAVTRPRASSRSASRVLDIDRLPAVPLDQTRPWPVHVVSTEQARELLALIQRHDGAPAALATVPWCELALPSPDRDRYHRIEVLSDGELVRVEPGNVYPVSDPVAFRALVTAASRH
jgi:hypothetical protein